MKSAEEWIEETTGSPKCRITTVGACSIEEIQLDAMKEGMRRARELVQQEPAIFNTDVSLKAMVIDSIISASEQLTIKDL